MPPVVRDLVLLLARVTFGLVFFAHGWQKLFTNGVDGTAAFFDQAGVPAAPLTAGAAPPFELIGGPHWSWAWPCPSSASCWPWTCSARTCSSTPATACSW